MIRYFARQARLDRGDDIEEFNGAARSDVIDPGCFFGEEGLQRPTNKIGCQEVASSMDARYFKRRAAWRGGELPMIAGMK